MIYGQVDKQYESPIAICRHCLMEIYKGDIVRNLDEIMGSQFIIHNSCLADFCYENTIATGIVAVWFRDNCLYESMITIITVCQLADEGN